MPPPAKSPPKDAKDARSKPSSTLGGLVVDLSPNAPPIAEQLRVALSKNAARVIDLFREWDEDKDGKVLCTLEC